MNCTYLLLTKHYKVTHHVVSYRLSRHQNKSKDVAYAPYTKTQLLLCCQHNLENNLMCHPVEAETRRGLISQDRTSGGKKDESR